MSEPRNDLVARLIAPELTGPVSPETAADLVRRVEGNAGARALHHVLARAAHTGSVNFADLEVILGSEAVAPYRQPEASTELLPQAVLLVDEYLEGVADSEHRS